MSVKLIWSNVTFKAIISLLNYCLDDLFIDISGVLKSPIIIVLLWISPFMSIDNCFIYLSVPMLCAYLGFLCPLLGLMPYVMLFFVFFAFFVLKSILSDMNIATSAFFSLMFA